MARIILVSGKGGVGKPTVAADKLYGDTDPAQFYLQAPPYSFAKHNGGYRLELNLPFVQKEEME